MKKIKYILLFIIFMFALNIHVNAECKDTELNDFVEDLEIEFLAPTKESDFSAEYLDKIGNSGSAGYSYYFFFSEKEYKGVKISNILAIDAYDGSGVKGEYKYQEAIDKYAVGGYHTVEEEVYKLDIVAVAGKCKGQVLKSTAYKVPRYNTYVQTEYCEKYPEHELCQKFTNKTENLNDGEFGREMAKYERELNDNKMTVLKFLYKYYVYILCAVVPVILISIYYRRRIKHLIKVMNQDEERHIVRRKVGLFLLCFFMLLTSVSAASDKCDIKVVRKRRIQEITGVSISVTRCEWGGVGDWHHEEKTVEEAVLWGEDKAWVDTDTCGDAVNGYVSRCVLKEGINLKGGQGKVEVGESYRNVYCKATRKENGCILRYDDGDPILDDDGNETGEYEQIPVYGYSCPDGGCYSSSGTCYQTKPISAGGGTYDTYAEAMKDIQDACDKTRDDADTACDDGYTRYFTGYCHEGDGNLKCPNYPCQKVRTTETPTIDIYEIDETAAYCVNPGNEPAESYQEVLIDPNKCVDGNSSVDCGFVNILLEAEYFNRYGRFKSSGTLPKISTEIITLAMRFWGAYTKQGGYDNIGLGQYLGGSCTVDIDGDLGGTDGNPFVKCTEFVIIDPETNQRVRNLNVYKKSVEYYLRLANTVTDVSIFRNLDNIDIARDYNLFSGVSNAACTDKDEGIICNNGKLNYALALFFNTRNGNKYFKEHLIAVYGSLSAVPTNVSMSTTSTTATIQLEDGGEQFICDTDENGNCKTTEKIISIDYGETITTESKPVDCVALKAKANPTEEEKKLLQYCHVEVEEIMVFRDDNHFTLYKHDKYYPNCWITNVETGAYSCTSEHYSFPGAIEGVSACQKSSCFVKTRIVADCSESVTSIRVKTSVTKSKSLEGFKKFVDCDAGNPRVNHGLSHQFLYQLVPVEKIETKTGTETEIFDIPPDCEVPCKNMKIAETKKECGPAALGAIESYSASNAHDVSIHDPSLSCILNTTYTNKDLYDYSDYFGVNTDICRIYCSDSAHFYLPDKTVIYSGLSFKYDIEFGVFNTSKSNKELTSIIEMRRNCVSEIYYDNVKFPRQFKAMAMKYGFTDEQAESITNNTSIRNWKDLYAAVYNKAVLYENKRNEQLKKLIYDLYNCNLYSSIPMEKPKDNTTGVVWNNLIKPKYTSGKNYGFEGCTLNEDSNTCLEFAGVTYEGGAKYAKDLGYQVPLTRVGEVKNTIQYGTTMTLNDNDGSKISVVSYCKGEGCFNYSDFKKEPDENGYEDDNINNGEYTLPHQRLGMSQAAGKIEYAGAITANNDDIPYMRAAPTEEVPYINDNRATDGVTYEVPKNDYAYFTISTKIGFFNVSEFQVKAYTGDVYDVTSGSPYRTSKKSIRTELAKGVYPTSKNSENCSVLGIKNKKIYHNCKITEYFGNIGTYHRNYGDIGGNNFRPREFDKFWVAINDIQKTSATCSIIESHVIENKDAVYRNVDLGNMFPTRKNGKRRMGENWQKAEKLVNETENYYNRNGAVKFYGDHLEYSYTLTREAINKIKDENAKTGSYVNDSIQDGSDQISASSLKDGKVYVNLRTSFIDDIESNSNKYGIINNRVGKTRGISDYTLDKNKDNNRNMGGN